MWLGSFSLESMQLMIYAHWDKLRRVIRDIKLELGRSAFGLFLKNRILSAHLRVPEFQALGHGLIWNAEVATAQCFRGHTKPGVAHLL